MNNLPEVGIGIMYLPGLKNLIESHISLINVLEIEPQTLWYTRNAMCDSIKFDEEQNLLLDSYPCPKLFHSVGFPVGGTIYPAESQFLALEEHASLLNPLWISEHLSFNTYRDEDAIFKTNFLLPPLQTARGIEAAVCAIENFRSKIDLPFAFETGVNYLKTQPGHLTDGEFVAQIAEACDCSILLDLHNLLANQKNGRQTIDEFVNQLPLERVSEIHVAGGFTHKKYYLDAHSGVSSDELLSIVRQIVQKLPALKAMIFEMLPEYVPSLSGKEFRRQLEEMNRIWDGRKKNNGLYKIYNTPVEHEKEAIDEYLVKDWELTLGKLAIGHELSNNEVSLHLAADPGLKIINELIFHFRASMVVTSLNLTTRLLQLKLGKERFKDLVVEFMSWSLPQEFPYAVAHEFSKFLSEKKFQFDYLDALLQFELATLDVLIDGKTREIEFHYNPFPVFRALAGFQLPGPQDRQMDFVVEIKPDDLVTANEKISFSSVYHT